MNYKIREGQVRKIPYILVMGDKEVEAGTVSVRARKEMNGGVKPVDDFIAMVTAEIRERVL